jgi:hypothetical protein
MPAQGIMPNVIGYPQTKTTTRIGQTVFPQVAPSTAFQGMVNPSMDMTCGK